MIGIAFGTRPEYIKLKPLYNELKRRNIPVSWFRVDQHSGKDFNIPEIENIVPEVTINSEYEDTDYGSSRLCNIVSSILSSPDIVFYYRSVIPLVMYKLMIVQGDTATAFGVALKCFNLGIPVAHVEAGMRTFSKEPFPEEAYRTMISSIATYHFCPSGDEYDNIISNNKFITGNTGIDNLVGQEFKKKHKIVLCTIHRRENRHLINNIFNTIGYLSCVNDDYTFIMTKHPSIADKFYEELKNNSNVNIIDSLDHARFLKILRHTEFVITDSGGISEEANYLGATTIVLRDHSERPRSVDYLISPSKCETDLKIFSPWLSAYPKKANPSAYGYGHASHAIADEIEARMLY